MKTVLFVNFTNQPFSGIPYIWPDPKTKEEVETVDEHCKWDNVPDSFAPGKGRYMEDWRAVHFANHLITRELDRMNKPTSDLKLRADLLKKCIFDQSEEINKSQIDMALMNQNAPKTEMSAEIPQKEADEANTKTAEIKKRGKPAKVSEPEFADLKN